MDALCTAMVDCWLDVGKLCLPRLGCWPRHALPWHGKAWLVTSVGMLTPSCIAMAWESLVGCLGWDVDPVMRCHGVGKLGWLPRLEWVGPVVHAHGRANLILAKLTLLAWRGLGYLNGNADPRWANKRPLKGLLPPRYAAHYGWFLVAMCQCRG